MLRPSRNEHWHCGSCHLQSTSSKKSALCAKTKTQPLCSTSKKTVLQFGWEGEYKGYNTHLETQKNHSNMNMVKVAIRCFSLNLSNSRLLLQLTYQTSIRILWLLWGQRKQTLVACFFPLAFVVFTFGTRGGSVRVCALKKFYLLKVRGCCRKTVVVVVKWVWLTCHGCTWRGTASIKQHTGIFKRASDCLNFTQPSTLTPTACHPTLAKQHPPTTCVVGGERGILRPKKLFGSGFRP